MPPPLAERARPAAAAEIFGQERILAPGTPLAAVFSRTAPLYSMALWGPPGCGKTTLARALAAASGAHWFSLSAVTAGLREVRAVIAEAESLRAADDTKQRALFVDEAHHFNKSQQDAFLPHVENGLLIFIGATTENPSFELNGALLSRLTVHILRPLDSDALHAIARRTAAQLRLKLSDDAAQKLSALADGDARRMLNIMEQAAAGESADGAGEISAEAVMRAAGDAARRFDKGGDNFYNQISALHKSVRGSDPDAALYWLCRMLDGGADPRYLSRRLIRIASEDIGLADPRALGMALDADAAYRRLGAPEGILALAQAAAYLACMPKSDAVYRAFGKMEKFARREGSLPVPARLCNAPTRLMKEIGFGKEYRHAHNEEEGYAAGEHYFPDGIAAQRFYAPTERGWESKIKARLQTLRARDAAARRKPPAA
ncbi:MAG: replication-associated recombination protein A [Gammaproteobacteria bacterium]